MTPFEAAIHADPYVYYSQLRRKGDLFFDAGLRLWIASGASAVEAILAHPDCRVRPVNELVPPAIAQSTAGLVFGQLMRMNEGPQHRCPRMAIEPALTSVGTKSVADIVARVVDTLGNPVDNPDELMFTLPASVIAILLGFGFRPRLEIAQLTRDFVACLSPLSNEAQLSKASTAATRLSELFRALLSHDDKNSHLLNRIWIECETSGWSDLDALIANLIGLLSQTCEATAGLIGNTLIALQRNPNLFEGKQPTPMLVAQLVAEVARHDSPVQNTRRFVAARCTVGDAVLEAGDTVLLLLASANRDPRANPDPDNFLLKRMQRRTFSFGSGRHECPGQQLALSIASEAILTWLRRRPASAGAYGWSYLPSLNGRIPQFHRNQEIQE